MKDIAVIGTGFSAAALSYFIKKKLDFYEKSRGVGGRCSTRRVENIGLFDHGLQYIKTSNPEFKSILSDSSLWQGNFKIFKNKKTRYFNPSLKHWLTRPDRYCDIADGGSI